MLRFVGRLVLLPFRIVLAAVSTAFAVGIAIGRLPVRTIGVLRRLLGVKALIALVAGAALGLAFAPGPGRELRAKIKARLDNRHLSDDTDLAGRVAFELEHAPRTWHLPQPSVSVVSGQVVLTGEVDLDSAREELGRVAAAVPGVSSLDNQMVVGGHDEVTG
jgi:hypothetical protein